MFSTRTVSNIWTYLETGNIVPGIGQELVYVLIMGVFSQIIRILIQFGVLKRIGWRISKFAVGPQHAAMDENVIQENYRVHELVRSRKFVLDSYYVL